MVRYISNVSAYKDDDRELRLTSEVFTAKGIPKCVELSEEVEFAAERLVPVTPRALGVGRSWCRSSLPAQQGSRCVAAAPPLQPGRLSSSLLR